MKFFSEKGMTMTELIITLAILGLITAGSVGIGIGFGENHSERAFESSCEQILNQVLETRNLAMMTNDGKGAYCFFNTNILTCGHYEHGKLKKYSKIFQELTFSPRSVDVYFDAEGIVTKGTTITMISEKGTKKYLVIQPVSGRIYLSDKKP